MGREGFAMGSPSSSSPRLVLLLAMTMIGFFVWAEVRARQRTNDTSLVRYDEPWFFTREAPPQTRLTFVPTDSIKCVAINRQNE